MKKRKSVLRMVAALTAFVLCFVVLPWVKPAVKAENRSGNFSSNYSLGNDPAQNMVNIAFAQEGKKGSQLGYNSDWCAWFVADCARLAGQDAIIPEEGRVRNLASAIKGEETSTPQVGDICIFDWNSVSGPYDHVEIVYKVSGSTVYTIGGNAGSTGNYKTNYVKTRNATSTGQVQCYIHPYYNSASIPENDDELGIPYPRPSGNPLLSMGSRGSGVSWLQTALNKANNAGLDVDGQFGSGTKQAVVNFQKANGLEADGIAGPATVNKLVEIIKGQMNPFEPPNAPDVTIKVDYDSSYLIFGWTKQENVDCYMAEIGFVNGNVIISNSNLTGNVYKWKFSQSNVSEDYYLKITTINNSGSSSTTKYFTISPQKPNLEAPNLNVDVNGQEVTFSWDLVYNATGYDLRIYNSDGTSYADYWDFPSNENSLTITMPANTEFSVAVCSKNSNYEECWNYCQPISFATGANKYTVSFVCDSDIVSSKEVIYGLTYGTFPKFSMQLGISFDGWYTEPIGGIKITENTKVAITEDQTLYARYYSDVILDPNGGYCDTFKLSVYNNEKYKELPDASRWGYRFLGWYTDVNGGTLVTNAVDYQLSTLYAHWEELQIKGDINDDGKADAADLVMLQKWILGSGELTNWQNADLCEDGVIDAFDMAALRRLLLN